MRADPIGLYIHIPFCVRKCRYCDFCSFADEEKGEYIEALIKDIESYKDDRVKINSIFFGGGTPSLLSAEEFKKIFNSIKETFDIDPDCEITLEANPKTLDERKLSAYVAEGVNRISLGLQSIHENELKKLGRIHSYRDFLDTFKLVRSVGIDNVNVDLMYGIPDQTEESFRETLLEICNLRPDHVSVYGLILEEGTPLFTERDSLVLPSEDEECDMYYSACDILSKHGYSHYEVSNYSLSGKRCRHNLKYWRDEEYIGVGLSAYSYFKSNRFGKTRNMKDYLSNPLVNSDFEAIDTDAEKYEYVMMRTRLSEGFSLREYKERFGEDFLSSRIEKVRSLIDLGYIRLSDEGLSFTDKGMYVGNSLLTELL